MKNYGIFMSFAAVLLIVSCGKKEEKPADTVTVEQQAPAQPENPDGTSVEIGKDGVNISTKDGDTKTEIRVTDEKLKVEKNE